MINCIFCDIINHQSPANVIIENDYVIAFHDVKKVAPIHFLVIPKVHIESIDDIKDSDAIYINHCLFSCVEVAKMLNIDQKGYRIVNNCKADGLQTVPHLHFHVLGGRQLTWPPG